MSFPSPESRISCNALFHANISRGSRNGLGLHMSFNAFRIGVIIATVMLPERLSLNEQARRTRRTELHCLSSGLNENQSSRTLNSGSGIEPFIVSSISRKFAKVFESFEPSVDERMYVRASSRSDAEASEQSFPITHRSIHPQSLSLGRNPSGGNHTGQTFSRF